MPEYAEYMKEGVARQPALALDAQPSLVTTRNLGIPAYLANLVDPRVIRVLVTPMKAAEIYRGDQKRGTRPRLRRNSRRWRPTGQVSSYGDYSEDGNVGSNYNWVPRQSYHFQTITRYGDRGSSMSGSRRSTTFPTSIFRARSCYRNSRIRPISTASTGMRNLRRAERSVADRADLARDQGFRRDDLGLSPARSRSSTTCSRSTCNCKRRYRR